MTPMLVAVRFLTRVPLGSLGGPGRLGDAAWCFPLVGVFIGACVGGAFWLAQAGGMSAALAGFVGVAAGLVLTGALHEDGLADMADGFGAPPDRALAAMRDSGLGAWGVLSLVVTVPMRALALAAAGPLSAIAAHALSRAAMTAPMHWMRPARDDGLAADAGRASAWTALMIGAAVGAVCGWQALPAAAVAAFAVAWLAQRRFGGYTGDVLGGVQQASEVAILLALAAA